MPQARYEEVRSAAEVEQRARLQAIERLADLERQLALSQSQRANQDAELEKRDQALAQSELDRTVLAKERDHAAELVDQLRTEVGRAGDHLMVFAEQKKDLAGALEDAEERAAAEAGRVIAVTRDLSLLMHEQLNVGQLELAGHEGRPVLKVPYEPTPAAKGVVAALAELAKLHPTVRYQIRGQAMRRIAQELSAHGLSDRLSMADTEEQTGLEIVIVVGP